MSSVNVSAAQLGGFMEEDGWMHGLTLLHDALAVERRATVDRLKPWLRHELYPACNLTMMPEVLKPGRHVCTCGLDEELAK